MHSPTAAKKSARSEPARGRFIVVEGPDRAGKTTLVEGLAARLAERRISAACLHFPDESVESGQRCRQFVNGQLQLPREDALVLFAQNRRDVEPRVRGLLKTGTTVLADRYAYSGAAYGAANGLALADAMRPDAGLMAPDLVLLLQCPPEQLATRAGFGQGRYEQTDKQQRVCDAFAALMRQLKAAGAVRCVELDASLSAAEVLDRAELYVRMCIELEQCAPAEAVW